MKKKDAASAKKEVKSKKKAVPQERPPLTVFGRISRFISIVVIIFAVMLVFGVLYGMFSYYGAEPGSAPQPADKPKIDTTITPARGVGGTWSGTASFQDNVGNPTCVYQGRFKLNLRTNGNNVAEDMTLTITNAQKRLNTGMPCISLGTYPATSVAGTVSSSSISLKSGNVILKGSFTSDLMKLNFESCPNQRCADGSYSSGLKGTASLTK